MIIFRLLFLLDGSGWIHIATPRTAESFLKTTHVTRTRHAHQVTASALSILLHTAYDAYSCEESEPKSFDEWCANRVEVSTQFQYWSCDTATRAANLGICKIAS